MRELLKFTVLAVIMSFSIEEAVAQDFGGIDKTPTDIAAYPSSYKISDKLIKITYGRPNLSGRSLSELAPKGAVWRTGANEASEITFYKNVNFGGKEIAAGSYALFAIPGEEDWTIVLNKRLNQWGAYNYDKSDDVARIKAAVSLDDESIEVFSIAFKDIESGFQMIMGWDKIRINIPIHELEFDHKGFIKKLSIEDINAKELFQSDINADKRKAIEIWSEIENQIATSKVKMDLPKELTIGLYGNIAKAYTELDNAKLSLLYYSKMMNINGSASKENIIALVSSDSVIEGLTEKGVDFQTEFVLKTRNIIREETGSDELANKIGSADQAYEALETFAYLDKNVKMILTSNTDGSKVYYRRWANRGNDKDWILVFTDKTLNVPRARYQIRYFEEGNEKIEDIQCADGCSYKFN